MKFPDSPFWNYSCRLFQLSDVADSCLSLQNSVAADVNLLLYCCWAGDNAIQLSSADIQQLIRASAPWQTAIIKPLRDARKMLKNQIIAMPAPLHTQTITNLSEMELNAEHMAQLDLEKTLNFKTRSTTADIPINISARNLMHYAQTLKPELDDQITTQLTRVLNFIYGDEELVQRAMTTTIG